MISNTQIAEYLTNIATALEIKKENRFRIIAYKNAADTAISYPDDIFSIWRKDSKLLDSIPNFGTAICEKLDYLFSKNKSHPHVKEYFSGIHPAIFTFTKINGIGPLIAHKLTTQLKFSKNSQKSLNQLINYAKTGQIRTLPTFGEKSEQSILSNTLSFLGQGKRLPLKIASDLAAKIVDYLQVKFPDIEFIPLGSLRRLSSTVGDIDIACASDRNQEIISYFTNYPDSIQTLAVGKNKASIRAIDDIRVDLMIKPIRSFGALLQHFTGSRQHNIILRRHALKLGFSLSEYGIKDLKTKKMHQFANEEKFYNFLGLKFIPPPERIGENELETYKML